MFSQAFPSPQIHPGEVYTRVDDVATDPLMSAVHDDLVLMGDMVYDFLAHAADGPSGQWFSDLLGYSENTYGSAGYFSQASTPVTTFPSTTYVPVLTLRNILRNPPTSHLKNVSLFFSPSPSPSLSPTSSTSEHHRVSPESPPTPKLGCHRATHVFNHIRGKWCCSVCDKGFRGKWECKRHIEVKGKRAICLGCRGNLSGREDSLRRHFTKYCKGNIGNLRFEDTFIEV
ncbi:hypothetical protein BDM02DRAFT_3123766 [Thelephora ganbajun]|uniref:Uncharacterized protein n=1 Tax=Thelephora ganbajun TaxID=370292 RepID=A0ACB6Z211_THEGA|nr:hypothetical protein BDM02DRAFT_3123766 [Thelephora ganbajun]